MHLHLFMHTNVVFVGSEQNIPDYLLNKDIWTLEEIGGQSFPSEGRERGIPVLHPTHVNKSATKTNLASLEKVVLCVGEQTGCFPNEGEYITLEAPRALEVM